MRYLNKFKLNENLTKGDSHQRYLELSVKVIELIRQQNDLIDESEDIFYEVLDIIGHDIIPNYKLDGEEYHSPEWESRFLDSIDYRDDEWVGENIIELDNLNKVQVDTVIEYQLSCDLNNWKPIKFDENLKEAIKSVEERYDSIGCSLEYNKIRSENVDYLHSISIIVPTKTDFSEILKSAVPIKMIKDFEQFCSEYNINPKGRQELARMLRVTRTSVNETMATRIGELNSLHVAEYMDIDKVKNFKEFLNENKLDSFTIEKDSHGYHCKFKSPIGKGNALLMDDIKLPMKDDEMFLFGIDTTPTNSGVGRLFLNRIFDEFNLNMIYIPSSEGHPVWKKIATKTDLTITMGNVESTIFTLTKNQLNSR